MASTNVGVGLIVKDKNLGTDIIESKNVPTLGAQFDIFTGKGTEKKLFALDVAQANVYGELESVVADDTTFAEIVFEQKRVANAIELSEKAILVEGVGLIPYLENILNKRNYKSYAKQAFGFGSATGSEAKQFQSILDYNDVTNTQKINGTDIAVLTGVTVANVDSIYGELAETYEGEAIFVVDTFATANVLTVDGKSLLIKENRANGSIGTIYGVPVFIQPMNGKAKLVLMNPKAYAISESENLGMTTAMNHVSDKKVFIGNRYAQGKVVDPNAIKIIK